MDRGFGESESERIVMQWGTICVTCGCDENDILILIAQGMFGSSMHPDVANMHICTRLQADKQATLTRVVQDTASAQANITSSNSSSKKSLWCPLAQ